ncbi:hypothetical protein [Streptomyces sp. NPDC048002]|uniref:substrate-binding domain-containing protein n=1 Tax=unclassified Streptomyces TaxID=2593676 RepID=UPI0033D0F8A8
MNVKSYAKAGAALGAAALGLGILSAPASADPNPTTDYRQLAGVGSDTTQYVVNGLGEVVTNASGKIVASWNATGTATVKTKATNCTITRPNGSSAGINALNADLAAGTNCIDFARSSRGPADTSTTDLTFIPFAKDGVTYATDLGSTLPTNLTTAQLADIYKCTSTTYPNAQPLLPQSGSGTRSFWLAAIGITEAQVGSCVNQSVQEHDGIAIANGNQLMPYSIAQWIAQGKGFADVPNRRGESRLRNINGTAPTTGSGSSLALNTGFTATFLRDVYNVVESARLTGGTKASPVLIETFEGSTSKVCAASSTITNYGFGTVSNCGSVALKAER